MTQRTTMRQAHPSLCWGFLLLAGIGMVGCAEDSAETAQPPTAPPRSESVAHVEGFVHFAEEAVNPPDTVLLVPYPIVSDSAASDVGECSANRMGVTRVRLNPDGSFSATIVGHPYPLSACLTVILLDTELGILLEHRLSSTIRFDFPELGIDTVRLDLRYGSEAGLDSAIPPR